MVKLPSLRKKHKPSDLPPEVQDYYQAEKRERVGVAGLLAVATLVVTVLVAMGAFFGGRWVYRTIMEDDDKPTQQAPANHPKQPAETGSDNKPETPPTPVRNTPPPNPAALPQSSTGKGNASALPSTGIGKSTVIIVLGSILLSSAAYYVAAKPKSATVVAE